jgi:hypothetical protein
MNSKMKRDSKDPQPNANNSFRANGDGNVPVPAGQEKHDSKKAQTVKADQRFTLRSGNESQPTRQSGDGNVPVTGEDHGQGKAERVTSDRRW